MRLIRSFNRRIARLTTAAVAVVACTTTTDLTPIATITLQPGFDSVEVGQTYTGFGVSMTDINGNSVTGRALSWESETPLIATVHASTGHVTGVAVGVAKITVRVEGKLAQSDIKVLTPIVSIVSSPDSFDLPMTTTKLIPVQLVGPGGVAVTNRTIEWSSSAPAVAVVSSNGLVTPLSLGTTTITIRAGTKQATVRVRVVGEPVASVRIVPQQAVHVIRLGQTKQLGVECLNAAQQILTGRTTTWDSSNPLVASVSSTGLVTGNNTGSATITARCDGVTGLTSAQVTLVPVASVSISPNGLSLPDNTQSQLTATARDSANNVLSLLGRQVVWASNNLPVAQVSSQGVVSAISIGTAQVTVSVDGVVSPPVTIDVTAFFAMLNQLAARREEFGARLQTLK